MPGKFRDQQVGQCESRTGLARERVEDEVTELWVHGWGNCGGPFEALWLTLNKMGSHCML